MLNGRRPRWDDDREVISMSAVRIVEAQPRGGGVIISPVIWIAVVVPSSLLSGCSVVPQMAAGLEMQPGLMPEGVGVAPRPVQPASRDPNLRVIGNMAEWTALERVPPRIHVPLPSLRDYLGIPIAPFGL